MRRAARTDEPHRAIVQALRQVGCDVIDLSGVGRNCPDLLAAHRGILYLFEVKSEHGKLSRGQADFAARFPVHVVRSIDEALAVLGVHLT